MTRDVMNYDVLIVGAGPAGLGAAIRLKQLANEAKRDLSICVLEKGAQVGAHTLAGAILDPIALNELFTDWQALGAPLKTAVTEDRLLWLSEKSAWRLPHKLLPPLMSNSGMYVVSLGEVCRWLGEQAESLGVEIYAGIPAQEILYDAQGIVIGVITGDQGRTGNGEPGPQFTPGIEIHARYTLVAEGTRGSMTRQLETRYGLRKNSSPQKYGLGLKEVWRVPQELHRPGFVQHTLGWPLDKKTGGGSFIYHYGDRLVAVGFVVHLDYANPYLSPFEEFQRFKTHPAIRPLLASGQRLSYGARATNAGGIQAWPELIFPGGALIGCAAGMVNFPRLKGAHNAIKTGMLAAEAVFSALAAGREHDRLEAYPQALKDSWVWRDLSAVRNVKPLVTRFGTVAGTALAGTEMWLAALNLKLPWTLRHRRADHESLHTAAAMPKIHYAKPDGVVTFDRLQSIHLSNISHDAEQPNHLLLRDPIVPIRLNLARYAAPEQRYCPAGVYEIIEIDKNPRLQINAQNCIHCKTCDIKDPAQNIVWVPPEAGSGPVYTDM